MYNKQLKDEFWLTLGRYMSLTPSATGEKVNWINYKTGVRFIQFKIDADNNEVSVAIQLSNPDLKKQERLIKQINEDLAILSNYTDPCWQTQSYVTSQDGRIISSVFQQLTGVNVYLKSDWPDMITFIKKLLMGLDRFWVEQADLYSMLSDQ